jgi:hypothetical protein
MTLVEIMQKITELSAEDRAVLRRELEETLSKPEHQEVTPETAKALHAACPSRTSSSRRSRRIDTRYGLH